MKLAASRCTCESLCHCPSEAYVRSVCRPMNLVMARGARLFHSIPVYLLYLFLTHDGTGVRTCFFCCCYSRFFVCLFFYNFVSGFGMKLDVCFQLLVFTIRLLVSFYRLREPEGERAVYSCAAFYLGVRHLRLVVCVFFFCCFFYLFIFCVFSAPLRTIPKLACFFFGTYSLNGAAK